MTSNSKAISLTGATILTNDDPLLNGQGHVEMQEQSRNHAHAHSHYGDGSCCSSMPHPSPVVIKISKEDLMKQSKEEINQTLMHLCRVGPYEAFRQIIEAWESNPLATENVEDQYDTAGHTLFHWASKRTDETRILELLLDKFGHRDLLSMTTKDPAAMTCLHWACTEDNSIQIVNILLKKEPKLMEALDGTSCTPLLIAAQYGVVDTVAYLIQKGADRQAVDVNRDTAWHWAAYKGSLSVLGLLAYYDTAPFIIPDAYLQTPLHLAALRGQLAACKYILDQFSARKKREILQLKDKNDRTCVDLAKHKNQMHVAVYLNQVWEDLTPRQHLMHVTEKTIKSFASVQSWKIWLGLVDVDESPRLPYNYVLLQIILHIIWQITVFVPVWTTENGRLWDCLFFNGWQMTMTGLIAYSLYLISHTDPGKIDSQPQLGGKLRQQYEETLEAYANNDNHALLPQLCHSCHIARPLRSKHDRFTRSCVLVFDHHCPFTANTIGLYNYRYFYAFLMSLTVYFIGFWVLFLLYLSRGDITPLHILLGGVYLGIHILMPAGMLLYHTQLLFSNLTTNEHLNMRKYKYLWETNARGHKHFRNPWNRGKFSNLLNRMISPGPSSYELSSELESLTDRAESV